MKCRVLPYGFIGFAAVLASGCGSSRPSVPTAPASVQTTPAPAPQPPRTVVASYGAPVTASQYPLSGYTIASRLTFYESGRFSLEMSNGPYEGTYKQSGNDIAFEWDGWSAAGAWGATGTVAGDKLTLHYNTIMQLTDFEDATYTRIQ